MHYMAIAVGDSVVGAWPCRVMVNWERAGVKVVVLVPGIACSLLHLGVSITPIAADCTTPIGFFFPTSCPQCNRSPR